MTLPMELIDIIPNSMTFRIVATLDLADGSDAPAEFTGRIRRHHGDRVVSVAWYTAGLLHNPGRHHPAFRCFRVDGQPKYELWYADGALHDPAPDSPAVRGFYADGTVHYEERWSNGRRHDGPAGEPAIRKWRADGTVRHELRYRSGVRIG